MRIFYILFTFAMSIFAAEVIITSNNFEGDEKAGVSKFYGNAKAVKGQDVLTAATFYVYTTPNRKVQRVEAVGDAKFYIVNDAKTYQGYADKLVYYPDKKEYELIGNAMAENLEEKRKVFGDYIVVNNETKKAFVKGNEAKPARFIFYIEDENKSKK
jgi:lipopolysaccharide export system protein LptA